MSEIVRYVQRRGLTRWGVLGALVLLVVAASAAVAFGPRRAVTRPTPACALPDHNYQFGRRSPRVSLVSMPVLPIQRNGELVPSVKLLQFPRSGLAIDHCSIVDPALQLYDDGTFVLTATAWQNPQFHGPQHPNSGQLAPGVEPDGVDRQLTRTEVTNFEHLLRNEFFVEVAVHSLVADSAESDLAAPVLLRIIPKPFFVERGQPYKLYATGCLSGIRRYFDVIETAELQFHYRTTNE